jgi:hypothetical protein
MGLARGVVAVVVCSARGGRNKGEARRKGSSSGCNLASRRQRLPSLLPPSPPSLLPFTRGTRVGGTANLHLFLCCYYYIALIIPTTHTTRIGILRVECECYGGGVWRRVGKGKVQV